MTVFMLLAGLLVAGALLLLLRPLLRAGARHGVEAQQAAVALTVLREQLAELEAEHAAGRISAEAYSRSREELERRALDEGQAAAEVLEARPAKGWALGLALVVPVATVAVYMALGTPDGLDPEKVAGKKGFSQAEIADMVGTLAARLEQEPDNVEGWMMLARSYLVLEDYPKAAAAYEKLAALAPNEPDVFADWADVVAGIKGTVVGDAEALAQKALAIAPDHPKALALAGTAAFQREDFAGAAAHWEKILAQVPAGTEVERGIRASINDARTKAGMALLGDGEGAAAAPAPLKLAGRLDIAAALRDRLAAEDSVFVFVRGEAGGPPLAALRFKGSDLPLEFSFDGVASMSGDGPVPERVMVAARVSKSGTPTATPGDLDGRTVGIAPDARGVALTIDQVLE